MHRFPAVLLLFLFGLVSQPPGAGAQQKSPDHVFQAVGQVEHYVKLLLRADLIDVGNVPNTEAVPRNPRHVFAKLIEVDGKLSVLRRLNGMTPGKPVAYPDRQITPADVFSGVELVTGRLVELVGVYGVEDEPFDEKLPSGMKPGDVYARLDYVSTLLDRSDIPGTVPNDVYRVAETASSLTAQLLERLDLASVPVMVEVTGKKPSDVLNAVVALSEQMDDFVSRNPDTSPVGGVSPIPPAPEKVTPAVVMDALNVVVADLQSMWIASGATDMVELAPEPVGKTPSDVFEQVEQARALLAAAQS